MTQFYSSGDVAALLRIPQHKLLYAIENGMVSDSSMRVGGKRIFSEQDLARLAEHFQVQVSLDNADQIKEPQNEI